MTPGTTPSSVRPDVPARVVVLVSGSGTLLQAVLDASRDRFPCGWSRSAPTGRASRGSPGPSGPACRSSSRGCSDHADRDAWDKALTEAVAAYEPDLVVSAGFMKILGPRVPRPRSAAG